MTGNGERCFVQSTLLQQDREREIDSYPRVEKVTGQARLCPPLNGYRRKGFWIPSTQRYPLFYRLQRARVGSTEWSKIYFNPSGWHWEVAWQIASITLRVQAILIASRYRIKIKKLAMTSGAGCFGQAPGRVPAAPFGRCAVDNEDPGKAGGRCL